MKKHQKDGDVVIFAFCPGTGEGESKTILFSSQLSLLTGQKKFLCLNLCATPTKPRRYTAVELKLKVQSLQNDW